MAKQTVSNYLKLRPSTLDSTRLINDRGDFVKMYSSTHYNVNGQHYYNPKAAAKAVNKWGTNAEN